MADPSLGALVKVEHRGPVAVLSIDHPPVNVLSASVLDDLVLRLDEVERDGESRVVVLRGAAEKAFAAGANIREMALMGPEGAAVHGARGQAATVRIEQLPMPVIAAVHGSCLGGGCEIALACDFVIASEDARFGQPEVNLGVMPGWGGTQRLSRRIGASRAAAWIMTGRSVTAAEARSAGWVHDVVPKSELLATAVTLAEELSQKPIVALAAAKYALNRAFDPSLEQDLAFELDLWARLFGTSDQKEGMSAFIEKRPWTPAEKSQLREQSRGFPWAPREVANPPEASAKRKN